MEEEHREPWEALSLIAAGYLAWTLWHCAITVIDYTVIIVKHSNV